MVCVTHFKRALKELGWWDGTPVSCRSRGCWSGVLLKSNPLTLRECFGLVDCVLDSKYCDRQAMLVSAMYVARSHLAFEMPLGSEEPTS